MTQATTSPPPDDRDAAFAEEEAKLAEVVRAMRQDIQGIKDRSPVTAAHQEAADRTQKSLDEIGGNLKDALAQPYFGRMDYLPVEAPSPVHVQNREQLEQKRIYVGATFVDGQEVYSWTGPVARRW
ncbi:MAG: hypothetical protein J4F32_01275 [Dehalococcoidia bacterium]|nr:hypothetical protein [Dehalococcoidia bacterium]